MNDSARSSLQRAAEKAALDSFFLGSLLAVYARADRRWREKIAQRLQCSTDQFSKLALCRCPREGADTFRQDVEQIAAFAGCDPIELARLVREATTLMSLSRDGSAEPTNLLIAARDRLTDGSAPGARSEGGDD